MDTGAFRGRQKKGQGEKDRMAMSLPSEREMTKLKFPDHLGTGDWVTMRYPLFS